MQTHLTSSAAGDVVLAAPVSTTVFDIHIALSLLSA
jgi:hypothetical protein